MIKFFLILLAIVAGLFIYASFQPSEFEVSRSITINASPEVIFPHVNNLHKSNAWSPWLKKDPTVKVLYDGPDEGTNAVTSWSGNKDLGSGSLTITASRTNEYVKMRLDFLTPMKSTAESEFYLKPEGSQTTLTWRMFGKKAFVQKFFCMFMNMDKMVGGTFQEGLADLKTKIEYK